MALTSDNTRRSFLMKMSATTAALLLPWQPRSARAAQVPAGSSWQLPGTWIPPQVLVIPDLSLWLNAHPNVRDAIKWENTSGTVVPYANWGRSQGALNNAYVNAFRGVATGLPTVPTNIAPPLDIPNIIASSDAWSLYLAHVAHSLAVELRGDLPWSITSMTASELSILFDSRQFFSWNSAYAGYQFNGIYGGGFTTLAPPDYMYNFLQVNSIPNFAKLAAGQVSTSVLYDAKMNAYSRLLAWCGDKLSHFIDWTDKPNLYAHWQYYGCPPVARVLEGTINPKFSPTLRHFTAGCFGTSAFLRALCRTMNIAVEIRYVSPNAHAVPYLPALDAWLSHGDDPYNSLGDFSDQNVGTTLSYPKSSLLISTATHDAKFGPAVSADKQLANVGYRVRELAVAYAPLGLLTTYLYDQFKGSSHADGAVASSLSSSYTVAQLEAMNLWGKMDGKIAILGGSIAVQALADAAQLEKEI